MVFRRFPNLANLNQMRGEMERLAGDLMTGVSNWPTSGAGLLTGTRPFPALNVWETEQELHAEAELPGVEPGDVDVSVVGNELTIKGQRTIAAPEGATFHRRERGTGSFTRVVHLPLEVDTERVQATLRDGVLSIVLPKAEAAKPRKIPVTGASI